MLIREEELEKCTAKKNDLLICEGGEAGRAAVWNFETEVCFQNHVHRARLFGNIDPYFAYRFFEKLNATGEIAQHRKGVGISNMSSKALGAIAFPLPPLPEQHRIVAKIDQLMARCDELERLRAEREQKRRSVHTAALKQLLDAQAADSIADAWQFLSRHFGDLYAVKENVAELRKAILQLAVMGKLVPQNPSDPAASQLLKEIETEKKRLVKEGKIKAQKQLGIITEDEKGFELPDGWAWSRFADFALDVSTGPFGSLIHQSDYVSDGIPLVNPSHMIDGRIVPDQSVSLPMETAKGLNSYRLNNGDMVMARRGEVGRVALVTEVEDGWLCGTGSFVLRFTPQVSRAFVCTLFKCASVRSYLAGAAVGTTMVNLNHGILLKMPIAVPPLPEQHRIVAKIDQLMVLCDTLEQRIDAATSKQTELLNALMAPV
jgi:type I restriction enzyme S subunit